MAVDDPVLITCAISGAVANRDRCLAIPYTPEGVIGVSRAQWTLVAAALALGGSIRVGLEDNFYLPDGEMARSNGELVERAARMTRDAGRRVATVDQARELLGAA
jgi:uncharacterized protein (DUF849 family)